MKEENKKSKKKVLLYYLILAACLLVIAAVTVTLIFTVGKKNPSDLTLDNEQNQPDDGNNPPDDGNKPGEGDNKPGEGDNNPPDDGKPTDTPTGYLLPVDTANVTVSFEFGYDTTLDRYCVHQGMDFGCEAGESVKAVLDGTILKIVSDSLIGENYITINHGNGITSTYKYLAVDENLSVGSAVSRGDVIGTVAEAAGMEMKQGEHLHFEISVNGKNTDPNDYLDIIQK